MSESVFLSPKSIAVVGASDKQGSVGRAITSNIMNGYKGTVYPISPTRETVFDQKAYKSVLDVPDPIDLAVVITKNTVVPIVLEECGKKGIKGAIVITAGFKEVDEEGKKLEQKLKDIATKYGVKVIGPNCKEPWDVYGPVGMSAMSFGALGESAISAISLGLGKATGSWVNTGEGGLAKYHTLGGGDVVMQIGPGLFGVRTKEGEFSPEKFKEKANNPQLKMFEIKLAQGAKIRGGHVEGMKINPEIAEIRGVTPWKNVDSPNRHLQFHDIPSLFDFIDELRELGGKPIGIKVVMGGPESANELCHAMAETGRGPDAITVDGGEGGSGATYQEMADTVGLPIKSGLIYMDDALREYGVRDQVKVFASGK